jgi:hypothetical protein
MLVFDNGGRIVIPDPIKLAAIDHFLYENSSIKKVVKKMIGLEHILFGWFKSLKTSSENKILSIAVNHSVALLPPLRAAYFNSTALRTE